MSHEKIKRLFEIELNTFALSQTPPLRVSYKNVKFTPKVGEVYLRSEIMPAVTDSLTLSGDHKLYVGLYSIDVVVPLNIGTKKATDIAESLNQLFALNKLYGSKPLVVQQIKPLYIPEGDVEDTVYVLPTHFRYRCDTN